MVVTVMVMSCTENSLSGSRYSYPSMHHMNSGALRGVWQLCSLSLRLSLFSAAEVSSRARGSGALVSHLGKRRRFLVVVSKENGGKRAAAFIP